ncbi:MAG: hypothetical protein IJ523_07225 [Succinivibrionaceae bacterium]|nr:hypothetical protein [Succinivibrionaceae bacterium]
MPKKDVIFFDLDDVYFRMKLKRKVRQCKASIFALSVLSGVLIGMAVEGKRKIDELEERVKRIEMAG